MTTRSEVPQWLLLCVLVLAVLGMHSVMSTSHEPATSKTPVIAGMAGEAPVSVEQPLPDPLPEQGSHGLLNLCLAVLAAGAVLVLARMLGEGLRTWGGLDVVERACDAFVVRRRFPGPAGRRLLATVCILRI
ncbi:hypothetical protein SacmaDRAFT_2419 [Saccharomonospora marina XMU15]|uniref:Uncharacterized protein n=1 Tax=Saccharomonospora marina XMU15 TaxID=882083 RepID=H5WYK0_9PSEU|nr:hypothetical protein [Saccharomonospora marina]EHR50665.1 hypothetical protein SacmaDRAFT_2419 [Saccharomonospora marina XMU15]